MTGTTSIQDAYGSTKKFVVVLVTAELNARTDWECSFTNDISARLEKYGHNLALTPTQRKQLGNLAAKN
ncbi:MAG: hypothetical protein ACRCTL_11015 [Pseudomonas sp.]